MRLPLVGIEDGSVCRQEKTFPMKGWLVGLTPPPVGRRSEAQAKVGQKNLTRRGLLMEAATVRGREFIEGPEAIGLTRELFGRT
jgi:hypothetical protein